MPDSWLEPLLLVAALLSGVAITLFLLLPENATVLGIVYVDF